MFYFASLLIVLIAIVLAGGAMQMANLTQPFDIPAKAGSETQVAMAAVKAYQGGAAAVVLGTGYATPLVVATASMRFVGVFEQTLDNSGGSAGDLRITISRSGVKAFNASGLTQADVMKPVYFTDDNTVSTTAGAVYAGLLVTLDAAGLAWVDITHAVSAQLFLNSTDNKIYAAGLNIKSAALA